MSIRLHNRQRYGTAGDTEYKLYDHHTAETKFSGTHGDRGILFFPVQLTTSRIGNLTRLIHTLLYVMTIHTYIHSTKCQNNYRCCNSSCSARRTADRRKEESSKGPAVRGGKFRVQYSTCVSHDRGSDNLDTQRFTQSSSRSTYHVVHVQFIEGVPVS